MAAPPPAVVQEGTVTYDGSNGDFVQPQPGQGVFVDYLFTNHYEHDRQTFMASLTSETAYNGATVAFVRLGGPTLLWVCEWTACQAGGPPAVPSPVPASTGWVLLDAHVSPAGKSALVDSKPIYRISGVYVYGKLTPNNDVYQDVTYPVYPWIADKTDGRKVPPASIQQGLTDTAGGSVGMIANPSQIPRPTANQS